MRVSIALFAAACAASVTPALAREADEAARSRGESIASPITDRFALRATWFPASITTDVRLDPEIGVEGTPLSAEDDLGLADERNQGRVELVFRLRERHRLRVDYFKLDRSAQTVLGRDVVFGDETFEVNDLVTSILDWRTLGFTYTYSVPRLPRFELGAGLGIHLLEARARGEVPARFIREEESAGGAFPTLALDGVWRITKRFALSLRGQYFDVSVDEFHGKVGEYHADLQFRWRPNLAFGVGYSIIEAELDVDDEDSPGRFSFDTRGPEAFVRVSF